MLKSQFLSFYKGTPNETSAGECYDLIENALYEQGILTRMTLIGALSSARVEVGKAYKPIREYASGQAYEGRKDLGNTEVGDGVRFAGRGILQITGRGNYINYGKRLGVDLVNNPELALDPNISAKVLAVYFKDRSVNVACDNQDWELVRRKINGGLNGYDVFKSVVDQFIKITK